MISDLASLRSALRSYIDREDIADPQLDAFIDVARRQAARARALEQERMDLLTVQAGDPGIVAVVLPPAFMEMRYVLTYPEGANIPQLTTVFSAPAAKEYGYRVRIHSASGAPRQLHITGSDLRPNLDAVQVAYFEFPSALVADPDTNLFLQANADLWLWQSVKEAARFLRNEEMYQAADAACKEIFGEVKDSGTKGRQYGGPRSMKVRA